MMPLAIQPKQVAYPTSAAQSELRLWLVAGQRDRAIAPPAGPGLGLGIARTAAEAHGGRLVLEASPAGGTRVRLELPLFRVSEDAGRAVEVIA
jgi:signal transduction histidine kinase